MKTVIIEYATISPATLEYLLTSACPETLVYWKDINEDIFEFSIIWCKDIVEVERFLSKYV